MQRHVAGGAVALLRAAAAGGSRLSSCCHAPPRAVQPSEAGLRSALPLQHAACPPAHPPACCSPAAPICLTTLPAPAPTPTLCHQNMITGVTKGYEYKMRLVYAHFPININIESAWRGGVCGVVSRGCGGAGASAAAGSLCAAMLRAPQERSPSAAPPPPPAPTHHPSRQGPEGGDPQLPGREDCARGGHAARRDLRALRRGQGRAGAVRQRH